MIPTAVPAAVGLLVKLFVIFGLVLYGIFAGVMVRQEHLMAGVLEETFEPILRLLVYIHLGAVLFLIGLAIIIL